MTAPRTIESGPAPITAAALRCPGDNVIRALATVALVWTLFTASASCALVVYTRTHPELDVIQSPGGLLVRAAVFTLLALVAGAVLWRYRLPTPGRFAAAPPRSTGRWAQVALAVLLVLVLALLAARIGQYPWAAPDEVHHLVVARNLAVHESYASGHPATGLHYFDSFDSVGPAVMLPLALSFGAFGVTLGAARLVIVAAFLGLCLALYWFIRGLFGRGAALAGIVLLTGTYSSIYLGRTVYGEVPSLLYLILGMLAWRRALACQDEKRGACAGWGLLAGALVAAAVLSKAILALCAFALLGTWLYDRATHRSIRGSHVAFPCAGGLAVLIAWGVFQHLHAPPGNAEAGGILAIYQHYLMFGVSSAGHALWNAVGPHPLAHVVWLGVVAAAIPLLFHRRHDPPAIALMLHALLMLYWWIFFTPGQLHRYLWNTYAIFAILGAPWLAYAVALALRRSTPGRMRLIAGLAALLLVLPGAQWIAQQSREIATKDEMAAEYAIADAIAALPQDTTIATDIGRLPNIANLFANRAIDAGPDALALLPVYDVVITRDSTTLRAALPPACRVTEAGAFVLLSTAKPAE